MKKDLASKYAAKNSSNQPGSTSVPIQNIGSKKLSYAQIRVLSDLGLDETHLTDDGLDISNVSDVSASILRNTLSGPFFATGFSPVGDVDSKTVVDKEGQEYSLLEAVDFGRFITYRSGKLVMYDDDPGSWRDRLRFIDTIRIIAKLDMPRYRVATFARWDHFKETDIKRFAHQIGNYLWGKADKGQSITGVHHIKLRNRLNQPVSMSFEILELSSTY